MRWCGSALIVLATWAGPTGPAAAEPAVDPSLAPRPPEAEPPARELPPDRSAVEPEPEPEPEPVAVSDAMSLDPGATCLSHDRLTEQIVTWLGRDELDPRLTVQVEGDPQVVNALRFTLHDRGTVIAERDFSHAPSQCEDLHAVVALAIALAVDATVLESVGIVPEPPAPAPAPTPTTPATPEPTPPRFDAVPTPGPDLTPREQPWRFRIRAGGLVTIGVPPPLGGGAELGIELGWRDLIDLHVGAFGASAGPQPIDMALLDITLLAGRADLCAGPMLGRVRPRFCGGVVAGSATAEGRGFIQDFQTVVPWVALAFGADLRISLVERLALSFDLDGLVTTLRPVFNVREELGVRKLRDLPRFGATVGMGLVVSLGEGRAGARP